MPKLDRTVIHHSVNDVIEILENQPVRGDLIAELPAVQTMNRISIAHLSIERAMKFVITEAGGEFKPNHDLPSRLNELREREPNSAKFLEEAFEDAVRHYRYNANVGDMSHLKSLETYLEATGTDRHFQDIRYWELDHKITFRPISLTLHLELLHAMSEILLAPERPKDTVSRRVERAVQKAMTSTWSYTAGSEKEISVKAYIDWLQGFGGFCEAMTQAFRGECLTAIVS